MTFDAYWANLMQKNPDLADPETKMTVSVAAFRKALEQAFEVDREEQKQTDDVMAKLFGGICGK